MSERVIPLNTGFCTERTELDFGKFESVGNMLQCFFSPQNICETQKTRLILLEIFRERQNQIKILLCVGLLELHTN